MNPSNDNPNAAEQPRRRPRFSILHTSARPHAWRAVYDAWLANADHPEDVEYVLVVDERWGFDRKQMIDMRLETFNRIRTVRENGGITSSAADLLFWNAGRRCYVEGVNLAAKHATGDILIVVADDQFPCEHWDTLIKSDGAPGLTAHRQEFVVWAPTGTPSEYERGIIVMPIMSRALYERWGYVMYPGYESMYSDNDLCEHAKAEGVLIEARHLPVFPHKHFLFTPGVKVDAAYEAQNRSEAYVLGERLLHARRANGFKDVPANPPTPIRSVGAKPAGSKKQSICVCLPGETFSRDWVINWTALLAVLSQKFILLPPIFGYSSSPDVTRTGMREEILKGPIPDFILWIDDDNILTPEQVLMLHADLEEHADVSLVAGWSWDADGQTITAGRTLPDGTCGRIEQHTMSAGFHDLFKVDWTGFPAVLMRGSLLVEAGPKAFIPIPNDIHPWYRYGEDISFCLNVKDKLLVIDRRVRVPHLKLGDNEPRAPKTQRAGFSRNSPEAKHDVLATAGAPA